MEKREREFADRVPGIMGVQDEGWHSYNGFEG